MQRVQSLCAGWRLRFALHVDRNPLTAVVARANAVDAFLHLAVTAVSAFHGVGGRGQE
jgi:hypothetical protein